MTPAEIVAIAGWAVAALVAAGAWLYSMAQAGKREVLQRDVAGCETKLASEVQGRRNIEAQLKETADEYREAKGRWNDLLMAARQDVAQLELDLSKCETPGARRARLDRLLTKLSTPTAPAGTDISGKDTAKLPVQPTPANGSGNKGPPS